MNHRQCMFLLVRQRALVAALGFVSFVSCAMAGSPAFGVSLAPLAGASPIVGVSAALPVLAVGGLDDPVDVVLRADVAAPLDFATLPAVGVSALLEAEQQGLVGYLGSGAALGWRASGGTSSSFLVWTFLAGVRAPVSDLFAPKVELSVAPFVGAIGVSLGVEVRPWR